MMITKEHIRHVILYEFHKGKSAIDATMDINSVYGNRHINITKCRRWYRKFKEGDQSCKDLPRRGRPEKLQDNKLLFVLEKNNELTTRSLTMGTGVSHVTVFRHLKKNLSMVCKLSRWVPHELTEKNRHQRVKICHDLYYAQLSEPFLDNLITGDEKWILYEILKEEENGYLKEKRHHCK
jgi:[histone H3]-lysine36 N-dimethyltransferase SETMAR